ncbi:MAG: pyrroline-5-carboxylate reductase [Cyclonatronaceae bacterium]
MNALAEQKLAVIGAGKMGETLISAIIGSGLMKREHITATAGTAERLAYLEKKYGIQVEERNTDAAHGADLVLLCVKPQMYRLIVGELDPVLKSSQLLISIMAGVTSSAVEKQLTGKIPFVRAMPNMPSLVGEGMTAICGGTHATAAHLGITQSIFDRLGKSIILAEKHFDAVTSLSASGPAFIYIIIEALAEGGVKTGLPRDVATLLAAQSCYGAAKMVLETGEHPAVLKDMVTTPAGCTIDGILKLEEGGIRVTLIKTIVEAARRAGELVENGG